MKRKILWILLTAGIFVCVFASMLSKCGWRPDTYPFPNRNVEIEKVELIHNQNPEGFGILEENFYLLKELDSSEIVSFMEDVYQLETKCRNGGPLWGYGVFFARVTYANGDVEYLGIGNIELISDGNDGGVVSGSEQSGYGSYYFEGDGFMAIFSKYADISKIQH